MKRWFIIAMCLLFVGVTFAEENNSEAVEEISKPVPIIGAIGNENEIGAWVGLIDSKNALFGIDGRYLDDTDKREEGYSVSAFVLWTAVPEFELPINGLFPQVDLPGLPESLTVALDLGARIGVVEQGAFKNPLTLDGEDNTRPEVVLIAALAVNPEGRASFGIRYEYKFDDGIWSEIGSIQNQHQAFLCLDWRF